MGTRIPIPSPVMAVGLGTAAAAAASYAIYKHFAREPELQQVGKVKSIFIYPIKSAPPIELTQVDITLHGMAYKDLRDREFMLLNPENKFITAREEPSLLLLGVVYNEEAKCLEITSKNPQVPMETLQISLAPQQIDLNPPDLLTISVWKPNHLYKCLPIAKASAWFSKYLRKEVKLVRFVGQVGNRHRDIPDRFHDAAELNILSDKSVNNLNELIRDPSSNISHRNFRPSILVDVKQPFEEDYWARMKIGDAESEFHSRCDRCVLTTINPDTGEKTLKEPLVTLRKYRVDRSAEGIKKYSHKPLFSSHHIVTRPGLIHVGQVIQAQRAPRDLL